MSGSQPIGHDPELVPGQIFYIMINISNKTTVIKYQQNNFMVGVPTTQGTILEGCSNRKVENHWYTLRSLTFGTLVGSTLSKFIVRFISEA